jgi:magnesium chelatase subunit I
MVSKNSAKQRRPSNGRIPNRPDPDDIMPYHMVIGQDLLKRALQIAYVARAIGGVLLSGQRGTGKSTVVRAFSVMVYGKLPVTLPINATEDRVVGGWDPHALLRKQVKRQPGLLEQANGKLLYIDEVNLLDDHIVNILLDATASGLLISQREYQDDVKRVQFTLVGTMNPSEGDLRPQLIDRFGLMAGVTSLGAGDKPAEEEDDRVKVLESVLDFDLARPLERTLDPKTLSADGPARNALDRLKQARADDRQLALNLKIARKFVNRVEIPHSILQACAAIGKALQTEGHRGDFVLAMAARANAAIKGHQQVSRDDVVEVASLALQHRRMGTADIGRPQWTPEDEQTVREKLGPVSATPPPGGSALAPSV